jgi:hypothetical protein
MAQQNGHPGAYAEFVQVIRDSNGPAPLPDEMRAKFESLIVKPK